jgi:uncharacterized membrane protein
MATPFPPSTTPSAHSDAEPPLSPRSVAAGNGASWWGEAWRLFVPSFGVWLLVIVILVVLSMVLAVIPVVGHLASQVLFPVFMGGLMLGCRDVDRGQPLTVNHLFAGFSARASPLFILGLLYTGIAIAIVLAVAGILMVFFGTAVLAQLFRLSDPFAASAVIGGVLMVMLVGALLFLLLYLPLIMAIWFAPALVVLRGLDPWAAMKMSFRGCLQNVLPFLIYGLIGIALAVVATIPLALGWLVLAPVSIASIYTAYCDIFEERESSLS